MLFPFEKPRKGQDVLIKKIYETIKEGKNLLVHAPTGLGKTAASLTPALTYALENDMHVFFLTSRHTQHKLVIETIKKISEKHKKYIPTLDLIGRQEVCLQPLSKKLSKNDFFDYCKDLKKDRKCKYYTNVRKTGLDPSAELFINKIDVMHSEELIEECKKKKFCPYEIMLELGKNARVIVCDYFHIFKTEIRNNFLAKISKKLENSILIIDEAHNLPDRIRSLMTFSLSTYTIKNAFSELVKYEMYDESEIVRMLQQCFETLIEGNEKLVKREELINMLVEYTGIEFDEIISILLSKGSKIREDKKRSFTLAIGRFLDAWLSEEKIRTIKRDGERIILTIHCLDPSKYIRPVIDEAYSSIFMSGTLKPIIMYKEILNIEADTLELKSPFPNENKLTLIVPETTTRFSKRSEEQFSKIAQKIETILNSTNVNTAVYFPSYNLLYNIFPKIKISKEYIIEKPNMTKKEKDELIEKFKSSKNSVLFGVISGSFGEGVDFPGKELECIIIVGIPLSPPDIYTKSLISFYNELFNKGWEYGYIYPALTKVIQSAGRCIRNVNDRGVIVLLDERYVWSNYLKCIPDDWVIKITKYPEEYISKFFKCS